MPIRHEEGNVRLRLFSNKKDAMAYPNAKNPINYAGGVIVQNENGRWVDTDGLIPEGWEPNPSLIYMDMGE